MNRDQFKLLAAGKYAEMQAQTTGTFDRKEMNLYVEGALFGWDMSQKEQKIIPSHNIFPDAPFKVHYPDVTTKTT